LQPPVRRLALRVVDQDVDAPEGLGGVIDQGEHRGAVGYVAWHRQCGRAGFLDFPGHGVQLHRGSRRCHDRRAFLRQGQGDASSYSLAGTGDDCGLARESSHVRIVQ